MLGLHDKLAGQPIPDLGLADRLKGRADRGARDRQQRRWAAVSGAQRRDDLRERQWLRIGYRVRLAQGGGRAQRKVNGFDQILARQDRSPI